MESFAKLWEEASIHKNKRELRNKLTKSEITEEEWKELKKDFKTKEFDLVSFKSNTKLQKVKKILNFINRQLEKHDKTIYLSISKFYNIFRKEIKALLNLNELSNSYNECIRQTFEDGEVTLLYLEEDEDDK